MYVFSFANGVNQRESPIILKETYVLHLPENARVGNEIFQINNNYTNQKPMEYLKEEYPTENCFLIDEKGVIKLAKPLDYETFREINLKITMIYREFNVQFNLSIQVTDVNDNIPTITVSSVTTGDLKIKENSPIGTPIAMVNVVDFDSFEFGKTFCSTSNDMMNLIQTERNSYQLVSNKVFDREVYAVYTAILKCRDGGNLESSVVLKVLIEDENDNIPIFFSPYYQFVARENSKKGFVLGNVLAVDQDDGINSEITYNLISETEIFSIDSKKGLLSLAKDLCHEKGTSYQIVAVAKDGGVPSFTATASITINIL